MKRFCSTSAGRGVADLSQVAVCVLGLLLLCCLPVLGDDDAQPPEPRIARLALGRPTPHPAVVRVVVPERKATSHGSGTLVDTHDRYGLVVTNWHVVKDAANTIMVVFPDGFQTGARVLNVDRDWDLAALAIWRPKVRPVFIALQPPQPGETLTIAGYGSGNYRAVSGRCTQYVSPGGQLPYEMVELAVRARQGDSGGPIFNQRGELAGVLFGSGAGRTSGSYSGRVRQFLASVWPPAETADPALVGSGSGPVPGVAAVRPTTGPFVPVPHPETDIERAVSADLQGAPAAIQPQDPPHPGPDPWESEDALLTTSDLGPQSRLEGPQEITWTSIAGDSLTDQAKTILAAIGVLAVLVHVLRFAGGSQ